MLPAAGSAVSTESQDFGNTGINDTTSSPQLTDSGTNAGSDQITTENGLSSETRTPPAATGSNGAWTSTTTNPDGTKIVDTYADGLLANETNLGTNGTTLTITSFAYDGMRRLSGKTDYTGTTAYTYFQDGTQATVTTPGHNLVTVNAVDPKNDSTTQSQRSDTGTINTPRNLLAQTSAQIGAGVLPATFGYDSVGTGQLTSLTTYQGTATFSGTTITGTEAATTGWAYDPATGQLASKTYADGSKYQYQYNKYFQLANVIEPGITASGFAYNNAGQLTSKSLTDSATGKVAMNVTGFDEMGRPMAIADTDNGHTYTTINTTNANQQPLQTMFGSAGNASVNYDYSATTGYTSTESPGALKTMTLKGGDGTTLAATSYGYDSSSKRLSTISVNGMTFTFNYFTDANQISSVVATATGGANVTTTYLRDSGDKSRIAQVGVQSGNSAVGQVFQEQAVSNGLYPGNGFNQQDQIVGQTTTRKDVADDGTLSASSMRNEQYSYDPNKGDALTSVTATVNGSPVSGYNYALDNVGNFTGNAILGTANNLNQYSGLTYTTRGSVGDDGTYAYSYDANNRLIVVTPHDTTQLEVKYGYDGQGRRLWKTAYTYTDGVWAPSYSRHYLWDGLNLAAETDGNNVLLVGYTWGPTGLLAVTDYSNAASPKTYQVLADLSQEQAVSNGAYPSNGFNQQDQIVGQTTARKDVADDGTLSASASKDYLYTYDPNKDDALTTVKDGATNTTLYGYALDNIGNRTGTSLGTANSVNDYSNLTYNSRHDLIDDGTNTYGWDAQDRLISVTPKSPASGSQEEKMGYNSQSQMLWQNVYAWNTTTSAWELSYARHFVYDASNMTAELDQSNALLKSYVWGPTGLIAETDFPADPANPNPSSGATTYQVISDLNANVLELVDPVSGLESASYHYGPFGEGRTATGPAKDVNPYGFGGGWTDKITGLIYFQHRWFSPTQGRFLSEDPNGTNGGLDTDAYAANDPINKRDPSGLDWSFNHPSQPSWPLDDGGGGNYRQGPLSFSNIHFSDPQVGWVYTATGAYKGGQAIYVGKADTLLKRVGNVRHEHANFLRNTDTQISVKPIYGDATPYNGETPKEALNRMQRVPEQIEMNVQGWSYGESVQTSVNGETFLNKDPALGQGSFAEYQKLYPSSVGESVIAKEAGAELDLNILKQLDQGGLGGLGGIVSDGFTAAFGILGVADLAIDQYAATRPQTSYLMAPDTDSDAGGTFTLSFHSLLGFEWGFSKKYISGSREGQSIDISKELGQDYKEGMESMWGYIDWRGHWQPGTKRGNLLIWKDGHPMG